VNDETLSRIGVGLLVYAAAAPDDCDEDVKYLADKIVGLRVFNDASGKMNLDVLAARGEVLLVSAFTVLADARRGRRPSFDSAASGEVARPLIDELAGRMRTRGVAVACGRFAEAMLVASVNDGPICLLLDSRRVV